MVSRGYTVVHSYGHFCRKVSPLHVGSQTLADKCAQPMKRVSKDTSEAFDSSERRCPWDTTVRLTCLKNCQFSVHDSIIKGEVHLLTKKNINTSLILQKIHLNDSKILCKIFCGLKEEELNLLSPVTSGVGCYENIMSSVKHGGGTVMVLSCFAETFCNRWNHELCSQQNILKENVQPSIHCTKLK